MQLKEKSLEQKLTLLPIAKKAPLHPKFNFTDVIKEKLNEKEYHSLIVQSGSVDITNLNTAVDPSVNAEYFRQEVRMSAQNIFSAVENALQIQPSLQKVVILKQIPRYDPLPVDPMSLKPALASFYNACISELWMKSNLKHRIIMSEHDLDCVGAIRLARYKESKSGRFNGIDLLGSSGKKSLTNSVLRILEKAGLANFKGRIHHALRNHTHNQTQ